jgi:hypothetical protein
MSQDLIPLLPAEVAVDLREVTVDDVIGGLPVVTFLDPTDPTSPRARFRLTAEACRGLGMALIASAQISEVTGWGKTDLPMPPDIAAEVARRMPLDAPIEGVAGIERHARDIIRTFPSWRPDAITAAVSARMQERRERHETLAAFTRLGFTSDGAPS